MTGMVHMSGTAKDPELIASIGGKIVDNQVWVPLDFIQSYSNNPDYTILVSEIIRPGVQLFATQFEYTYFTPGTGLNELFNLGSYEWEACFAMPYMIMFFPSFAYEWAVTLGKACDIRLTNAIPTVLGGEKPEIFPINGASVYRLENLQDSDIYKVVTMSKDLNEYKDNMHKILEEERIKVEEFLDSIGVVEEKDDRNSDGNRSRT